MNDRMTGRLHQLHPRHGPHQPATSTPARRPGSVRRTTTHTTQRPDGFVGPLVVTARGRDLYTPLGDDRDDRDGANTVDQVALHVRVDMAGGQIITELRADPPEPRLDALTGIPAGSGFRRALDQVLPREGDAATLRYQLLDDIPTVTLVSGHATVKAQPADFDRRLRIPIAGANQCAGWADGGTIMLEVDRGFMPPLVVGPAAPDLDHDDDPLAWHAVEPMPLHATRRRRRIDVWQAHDTFAVDAFFRDSHMEGDGFEEVVHEYAVRATVDVVTGTVRECAATVGALPFVECVGAAASAGSVVGVDVRDLRSWVRREMVGTPTCTHLNDTLRALADVPALVAYLPD
jgi:hypothetical protein